jgi:hypothetical protein
MLKYAEKGRIKKDKLNVSAFMRFHKFVTFVLYCILLSTAPAFMRVESQKNNKE